MSRHKRFGYIRCQCNKRGWLAVSGLVGKRAATTLCSLTITAPNRTTTQVYRLEKVARTRRAVMARCHHLALDNIRFSINTASFINAANTFTLHVHMINFNICISLHTNQVLGYCCGLEPRAFDVDALIDRIVLVIED
ncbi:hypothetical protein PHMEG_00032454 [Phytophthora megakarya]|uniref:Uncharacterized protein n=1 Tax=Phytophthora megakarya TaxID=4795 RepID=A0A225UVX9_9STRA|nr:hypothetical protein PHMEG_00032454 [Phytophthora megakarya]